MNKIMGYDTGIVDEWENVFELAMIVSGFAYYANYEESDENGNTIVANDKNEILSNNIFANNDFISCLFFLEYSNSISSITFAIK